MTDPIRTPAEALEAALAVCDRLAAKAKQQGRGEFIAHQVAGSAIATLASRIAAPDDEVLSRLVAASEAPAGVDGLGEVRVRVSDLRDALTALREAGALRHE